MDALYDIYLTGKLLDGTSTEQAQQQLAQIFKATADTMAGLLTGKPQLLKRGVDKNTALKYREALTRAGVEVAFKAQENAPSAAAETTATTTNTTAAAPNTTAVATNAWSIAPAGADLLSANERQPTAPIAIDISHLSVAPLGPLNTDTAPQQTPAAPNTDFLTLAAPGSDVLSDAEREHPQAIVPDISDLSLAPVGALLETLHEVPPPVPDTSDLSLAEAGADLLKPEERKKTTAAAPNTDHLQLIH